MNECLNCSSLPATIQGKAVSDIGELAGNLETLKTDPKLWISLFRCKICGQEWEERYESKGHANVPSVRRIMNPDKVTKLGGTQ